MQIYLLSDSVQQRAKIDHILYVLILIEYHLCQICAQSYAMGEVLVHESVLLEIIQYFNKLRSQNMSIYVLCSFSSHVHTLYKYLNYGKVKICTIFSKLFGTYWNLSRTIFLSHIILYCIKMLSNFLNHKNGWFEIRQKSNAEKIQKVFYVKFIWITIVFLEM